MSISGRFFSSTAAESELSSVDCGPFVSTGPFCLQLLFRGLHFGFRFEDYRVTCGHESWVQTVSLKWSYGFHLGNKVPHIQQKYASHWEQVILLHPDNFWILDLQRGHSLEFSFIHFLLSHSCSLFRRPLFPWYIFARRSSLLSSLSNESGFSGSGSSKVGSVNYSGSLHLETPW